MVDSQKLCYACDYTSTNVINSYNKLSKIYPDLNLDIVDKFERFKNVSLNLLQSLTDGIRDLGYDQTSGHSTKGPCQYY